MHLHEPAAADAQPWAPRPESQVSYNVAGCIFFCLGPGERAWTIGEMWPLPFLQKDGIHGGWTLQGLAPAGFHSACDFAGHRGPVFPFILRHKLSILMEGE